MTTSLNWRFSILVIFAVAVGLFGFVEGKWGGSDTALAYTLNHNLYQVDGPALTVASNLSTSAGTTVTVPIALTTSGNEVVGIGLSIDFDENCLSFDNTDADNSGVPDTISFDVSPQFFPSVSFNASDTDGEIDIILADYSPPLVALVDTQALLSITFTAICQPASADGQSAAIGFTQQPAVSFSDPHGVNIDGSASGGTILILPNAAFTPVPPTPAPTATATPVPAPTETPAAESTAQPPPVPTTESDNSDNNRVPTVSNDSATTNEDISVTINVLANDSDPDGDMLSIVAVEQPLNGIAVINGGNSLTYIPQLDFHGSDLFAYTASDGRGGEIPALVRIMVRSVNDPPVLLIAPSDQSNSTGDQVTLLVSANDPDTDQDLLTFRAEGLPPRIVIDPQSGVMTGTLTDNDSGTYAVTVTVSDGELSDTVQFAWEVSSEEVQGEVDEEAGTGPKEGETVNKFVYVPFVSNTGAPR